MRKVKIRGGQHAERQGAQSPIRAGQWGVGATESAIAHQDRKAVRGRAIPERQSEGDGSVRCCGVAERRRE